MPCQEFLFRILNYIVDEKIQSIDQVTGEYAQENQHFILMKSTLTTSIFAFGNRNIMNIYIFIMSKQILTPSKPKKLKPLSLNSLHKGMHSSSFFKSVVLDHMKNTQTQNHLLSSVNRQYLTQNNKNIRSHSLSQKIKNPEMAQSKELKGKDDEIYQRLFNQKTHRIPEIEDHLKHQRKERLSLLEKIKSIKQKINNQEKLKDKIDLNCKKMNINIQRLKIHTESLKQENHYLSLELNKNIQSYNDYEKQYAHVQEKNTFVKEKIKENKRIVGQLKEFNTNALINLRKQTKSFNQMKDTEIKAIKSMSNFYMYQNQLKEEKALYLGTVGSEFNRNK